jgi:pSer/pThr/pTyr-binding forkhead associated (FHA) protein
MTLLLTSPAAPGGHFLQTDRFPFTVGRSRSADGLLPLGFISRRHCRFRLRGQEVLVEDLGSANGTYVNGVRVTRPTPVRDGDDLQLGPLGLRIGLREDPVAPRPAPPSLPAPAASVGRC